jgi:hypothetical protein
MSTVRSFRHRFSGNHLKRSLQLQASSIVVLHVHWFKFIALATHYWCKMIALSSKYTLLSPNPLCEKSNSRMVHTVPLLVFMDNVSGNVSKQWNKHYTIYMSNANLPHEILKKEFFVWFVASSPHAAPMELMQAMKESIWYVFLQSTKVNILIQSSEMLPNPVSSPGTVNTMKRFCWFCMHFSLQETILYKQKSAAMLA